MNPGPGQIQIANLIFIRSPLPDLDALDLPALYGYEFVYWLIGLSQDGYKK